MPSWLADGWNITGIRVVTKQEHFANLDQSQDGVSELVAKPKDIIYTVKGPPGHGTAYILARVADQSIGIGMVRVATAVDEAIATDVVKFVPSHWVAFADVPLDQIPRLKISLRPLPKIGPNYAGFSLIGIVIVLGIWAISKFKR